MGDERTERAAESADSPKTPDAPRLVDLARQIGPRFARDAFGPALTFYVGWRTIGFTVGIVAATAVAVGLWIFEQRRGHEGLLPRLALAIILIQGVVGLTTGSPRWYLAQPAIVGALMGLTFLGSAIIGRPLAAAIARDLLDIPISIRESPAFVRAFRTVTVVWAVYFLARAALRLFVLAVSSIEVLLVVTAVTGAPIMSALAFWSLWYSRANLIADPAVELGAETAERAAEAAEWPSD